MEKEERWRTCDYFTPGMIANVSIGNTQYPIFVDLKQAIIDAW